MIYDYYFKNQCIKCSKNNPTLDYAEFTGTHPYQIGDLWPKQPINIWIPMVEDGSIISSSIKLSGSLRIQNLSAKEIILIEHQIDDKITRTQLMNEWTGFLGEHHRLLLSNLFLPEMIKLVDPKPQERILEIGCGNGEMSRLIAHASSIVTGIDTSKNIEKAISQEKEVPLNITYHKSIIEDLIYNTNANMYDKIVCNLQIMIIQDAKSFFENAFYLLKLDGELVFSIPHPFFSLPNGVSIRIPADSNRNEDKFWMIDNYFSEGPVRILGDEKENNQIFFRRTLSTYLNNMTEIGFTLVQISEPQSKPELVSKFVSQMFNNTDRFPSIMIIRAKKKSKNY